MESATSKFDNKELNKLRLVFEHTPVAIFILDREFRFEYVNPGFTKLSGYTEAELIGNTVGELFYHEDLPESRKEIVESLIKGEKWQGELLTFNKNGLTYWANTLAAPYKDENGIIDGYVIIQHDITDKKKVENALFESETKYKTLVENSHDGIMIIRDNKILYANDTICDMLGYCLTNQRVDIIHPDDSAKMIAIGERRRNGDMSTIHESLRLIAKNGEIKECETASTMVEFNGAWGAFYTVHDVTERNRFEEELKNSEEKYRQLFAAESDAIFMIDADTGQILDVNPATTTIYGYSYDELLKMKNTDVSAEPEKTTEATLKNLTRVPYRLHKRKDGTIFPVELSAGFTEFKNRKIQIVTSRDITERIKTQEALTKSEQKYRELADFLPQTVYELDNEGNLLYVNKSGMEVFGISEADYGKSVLSYFIPEDHARMLENLKVIAREIRPNAMNEYTAIKLNGITFPVIIYGLSVLHKGKPIGTRGIIVDISDRKAMENALRESESKYKTLIENSQDGIFAVIEDKILFANNTFCKMVGYTPQQLYDKPAYSLVFSEDRERGSAISERRKKGDVSTINDIFRFVAKDGSLKEGDVFSSVMELNGQRVSYITVHDLTQTRKIQEELIKSEQKYRELSEMLPQTVYELDVNANLKYLNKAGREKFGTAYETSEVSVFSIVIPEELERMKYNFFNVSDKKIPSKGNFYKLRQVNGQIFEAMISATPMIVDGKTVGQRGVVIDITDHVNMQKALKESEEKHRTLIENATDGIVIVQNGLLKFANQTMCDIMKYSMEELMDKPFLDYIDSSEHESLNDFHNRRMEGKQFSNILRSLFIRKDKKMITVELNARTSNYNGSPAGFIIIRDITDRLKIENELQIAKSELEKLNTQLEKRVKESSKRLTEAKTQLINLQKENLQSQYDVLKQQVNPHFLFNSLNVLTSLIKLEPDLAEKFTEQLSKVYRYVLENKDNDLVDLNTELSFLDAYIFLLNIRFVGKLQVNLNVPDENRNDKIIPLAMQLLIENAIKHNIMSKSNPLIIDIFIDKENRLNVINNLQERPSQIVSTGVGLKNILNRYQLLNLTVPVFQKTENRFVAKIQLVKSE